MLAYTLIFIIYSVAIINCTEDFRHYTNTISPITLLENNTYVVEKRKRKKKKGRKKNKNERKPNILIILADDVGTGDIPFYWKPLTTSVVKMPNLQNLANKGVLFTDAHSSPKCAPSRYMLLSGNYPHRGTNIYGTRRLTQNQSQFTKFQKSLAELLRDQANYETAVLGKWHLGAKLPPKGAKSRTCKRIITNKKYDWSLPLMEGPAYLGFNHSYITYSGIQFPPYSWFRDDMLTTKPSKAKMWKAGSYKTKYGTSIVPGGSINKNGEGDPAWDSTTYDMRLVEETHNFIKDHLKNNPKNPFFAYVALAAVHRPHTPTKVYMDGSKVKNMYKTEHLDMLGQMDKVVGSLVKLVEKYNLEKDTIIIFASDNGGLGSSKRTGHATSGPLRGNKGDIWEGGHRIPLIIRYDRLFPANERRNKVIGLNDIYATICEMVGIKIPFGSAQDSVSFAKYIENERADRGLRKYLGIWEFGNKSEQAIRKNNLKLVHIPRKKTYEMFDLKNDISEKNGLYGRLLTKKEDLLEMYDELMAIGPCPIEKDSERCFRISEIKEYHDCKWFKQKRSRCDLYVEGNMLCPSACNRFKKKCKLRKMNKDHFKKLKIQMNYQSKQKYKNNLPCSERQE